MRRWLISHAPLALAVLLILTIVAPTSSQAQGSGQVSADPGPPTANGNAKAPDRPKLSGPVRVMIELADEPAVVAASRSGGPGQLSASAARTQAARNDASQQSLLRSMSNGGINVRVTYRVQKALNGIASVVDGADIPRIQAQPGVKSVKVIPLMKPTNASSVPLINSPTAWAASPANLRGDGIKIGIIDTGIDYIHRNFGGTANYAGNNTSQIGDTPGMFPGGPVVVGGTDFAGDTYDAGSSNSAINTPHPDPDPMDCEGHGSHVAGSAAGRGVKSDNTTFSGPYDGTTPFGSLKIGPGVAPAASLYALKVFGCTGSTDLAAQAIDWALDPNGDSDMSDHLDVINMSLGSDFGYLEDPSVTASDNAALAGMIVVASAGNANDVTGVHGTPAAATRAIAVAASDDSTARLDAFAVTAPPGIVGEYVASASANFDWTSPSLPVSRALVYPATVANQSGCTTFSGADATAIVDKIVLLDWIPSNTSTSPCGSATRVGNAASAGAKGVILVYNLPALDISIAGTAAIPAVITTSTVGTTLKNALLSNTVIVTLDDTLLRTKVVTDATQVDRIADFSSRGPGTRTAHLKPDLTAPGVTIFSTGAGTGTEGATLSGTSMASPHVAGLMALLKQQHPAWTVEELKALAMNTANHDVFLNPSQSPPKIEPSRAGAGRVDAATATASTLVAFEVEEPGRVSVSFGPVDALGATTLTRTVKIANKGGTLVPITVGYTAISDVPGVAVGFPDGTSFQVPALGTMTFRVHLAMDPAAMKNTRNASMAATQEGFARQFLAEVSGLITVTPNVGPALRLPLYASVRPASDMHAGQSALTANADTQTFTLPLTGTGVDNGTAPTADIRSLASAFELQATSPAQPPSASSEARAGDLRYVGVSSDGRVRGTVANSTLYFGLALEERFFHPVQEVDLVVQIDTNRDGAVDYELFNGQLVDGAGDSVDVMVTGLYRYATDTTTTAGFLNVFSATRPTAIFNTNVQVMSVPISSLAGLSTANSRFTYRVQVYYGGVLRDSTAFLSYDWLNPGLDVFTSPGETPFFFDLPTSSLNLTYNKANLQANGSQGLLLLHHYNRDAQRAEVVTVSQVTPLQPQTVSFAAGTPTNKVFGDPPFAVSATASSGLPVTIASLTPAVCAVGNGNAVTLVAGGTCRLRASQAGNGTFQAASADHEISVAMNACLPRPNVSVTTSRLATGQFMVIVTAGSGTLQSIRFGTDARALQNATVQIVGASGFQATTTGLTVPLPPNTTTQTFFVNQTAPGQAMNAPFIVTDGCGPWPTFVGVGAGG